MISYDKIVIITFDLHEVVFLPNRRFICSFALFFGWLLSFPLNGPLLYRLAAERGFSGDGWGLIFSGFHATGFLVMGFFPSLISGLPRAVFWASLICIAGMVGIWFVPISYGPYLMALMGLAASWAVMGYAYNYTRLVTANRLQFMAAVILLSNLMLYIGNLLFDRIPLLITWIIVLAILTLSLRLRTAQSVENPEGAAISGSPRFPVKLLIFSCVLIFGLSLNGGLMYQVIFPSFGSFLEINRYFGLIPYLGALLLILLSAWNREKMGLVYLGSTMLGLGFIVFALPAGALVKYVIIDTLILGGFALLDLFVWGILGDIAEGHGRILTVFGFGLFANVFPLFLGGVMGVQLKTATSDYPVLTALLASAAIFLTSLLFPVVVNRLKTDLLLCERQPVALGTKPHQSEGISSTVIPEEALTAREKELLSLILDGYTNEDLASKLSISVNTVKVHIKSITRKFGVTNKNELLALIIKTYKQQYPRL